MSRFFKISFFACFMLLFNIETVFSQIDEPIVIKYDSIRCIGIDFSIFHYKLSLYNIVYTFCTKDGDTIIMNKRCNYQTSGIYYDDRRWYKLFGFEKDSIYSVLLSEYKMDRDEQDDRLSYYSYVKFSRDRHTFKPQTFNPKQKIRHEKGIIKMSCSKTIDINNKVYAIDGVSPFHGAPDYLLPPKIYPFYILTKEGEYIYNAKDTRNKKPYKYIEYIRLFEIENKVITVSGAPFPPKFDKHSLP